MRVMAGLGQGAGLEAGTQGGQREEEMGEQGRHERGTGPMSPSEAQPLRGGRGLFHLTEWMYIFKASSPSPPCARSGQ